MTEHGKDSKRHPGKHHLPWPFLVAIAAGVLVVVAVFVYNGFVYVATDDAFVEGRVVMISPRVSSHVARVLVDDNQAVKEGDPLVELDARDFEARLNMAAADLAAARAEEEQSREDAARYAKLSEADEVSKQQYDRALLRARTAQAKVATAEAALQEAELNLSYTHVISPANGNVARKSVEAGAFVQPGQALLAVVSNEKWIVANFKETELTRMRPGQKVSIRIDTYPGQEWHGHVDSMQRGTGARFSLFPPENAAGNYVKVVQRVPVKIVFDDPLDDRFPLSVGMSVVPRVRVR